MTQLSVCTLFEKDFHVGVGALFNSLVQNGFTGRFWAGYKGPLPAWVTEYAPDERGNVIKVPNGAELHFIPLDTTMHFAHYKPDWMLHVLEELDPQASGLIYFDPDIVVKCRWGYFEEWCSHGVALCGDVNYWMPSTHPYRYGWMEFFKSRGVTKKRDLEIYINSGFMGADRRFITSISEWRDIITALEAETGTLEKWRSKDRSHLFSSANQDGINIMAMATEHPVSVMGPDAMGFVPGGKVMEHSVGYGKPWQRSPLRRAIEGRSPSACDVLFWQNTETPLRMYPAKVVRGHKRAQSMAAFIGRFYRRR